VDFVKVGGFLKGGGHMARSVQVFVDALTAWGVWGRKKEKGRKERDRVSKNKGRRREKENGAELTQFEKKRVSKHWTNRDNRNTLNRAQKQAGSDNVPN